MAAAEARGAWQRTANRCFEQEDTKRAPKLSCPSSAYSSSKNPNSGPENTSYGPENPILGFIPQNRNSSYSNLSPESRWWLQIQPDYIYQKGSTHEQVNTVSAEMEICEIKDENCGKHSEMAESYELLEMESNGYSASNKIDDLGFEPGSPWCGSGRSEPWWRVADKDELASWVSQRSLDLIENCDLPQPQNKSIKKEPCNFFANYDHVAKAQKSEFSSPKVYIDDISSLKSACRMASCEEKGQFGSDKHSSYNTIYKTLTEPVGYNPTKVQLMEALCHSQTRAREAEKAAKQANTEKEHIIKLFFKQASHLFAYKQWFQLLQLEKLSSFFPVDLPFNPDKNRKLPKKGQKPLKAKKQGKRAREQEQDFGKFAIAFALGLGLVGAGLFLGWTIAWMLPAL